MEIYCLNKGSELKYSKNNEMFIYICFGFFLMKYVWELICDLKEKG